jgi:hypothetical protein
MEKIISSETRVLTRPTRHHIPEEGILFLRKVMTKKTLFACDDGDSYVGDGAPN